MMLTTEDVIKQETLLNGFVPFVELAIEVKQLPFARQIAFFCSYYERIIPIYMLVNGNDGWGNISILYSVRDDLWKIAGGSNTNKEMIACVISKVNGIFVEYDDDNRDDEWEIRQGLYVYFGEEIVEFIKLILEYIEFNISSVYFKIFTNIIFIMYEYLGMYFANTDSNWELKTQPDEQDSIGMNSSLMQAELEKELADLELLKSIPELTPDILSAFRANACPDGLGILGSLDKVRANLEGTEF